MSLSLKELVELAALDSVMDKPISLDSMMQATTQWHELNGRTDVRAMFGTIVMRLLDDSSLSVADHSQSDSPVSLVGGEAVMVFERACTNPEAATKVEVTITEGGQRHYKQLAQRYYNGGKV